MPDFDDLLCGEQCLEGCTIQSKMTELQDTLVALPSDPSESLIQQFLESYKELCRDADARGEHPLNTAFPALFDFVASAHYARRMVADDGWTFCAGNEMPDESPALYFPYLRTCPRCSVKRGKRPRTQSNKPGSDPIGEISSNATIQILAEIIRAINPDVKFGKSSDRQGDVDVVIYDDNVVVLAEIKSSPMVLYPLEVELSRPMTEVREGETVQKRDHTKASAQVMEEELNLYIPHVDVRIPVGTPTDDDTWPFDALRSFVSDPQNVSLLIKAWKTLYDVYCDMGGRGRDIDPKRWILCGCGGQVDDSKNAPGMDRTDDIKKGTYQVLKFGTYYKEKCARRIQKAVLLSNFLPVRKFDRYLSEMHDVIWTKDKYSVEIDDEEVRAFRKDSVFNLHDALICFTQSIFNDDYLKSIASLEEFEEVFFS